MKDNVLRSAAEALRRAEAALRMLESYGPTPPSERMDKVLAAWSDLLTHGNRVFSKLEHGCKAEPAKSWFAKHKTLRKEDPLLAYLKCARDVDEHGLDPVADEGSFTDTVAMVPNQPVTVYFDGPGLDGHMHVVPQPGVRLTRVRSLQSVKDRDRTYQVPHQHVGTEVNEATPLSFATLFVAHLRSVVDEAAQLSDVPT